MPALHILEQTPGVLRSLLANANSQDLDWQPREDRWSTMARAALRDDLYAAHAELVCDVLKATGPGTPEERLAEWASRNEEAVRRTTRTLTEIWETERSSLATLSVAVRAVRSLVASGIQPVHS